MRLIYHQSIKTDWREIWNIILEIVLSSLLFFTGFNFQKHSLWALKIKLTLKMRGNIEGGFLLKQCLPCWGNIMTEVFSKQLELNVFNYTYSVLTSFKIKLIYDFSLKSQKPCWGFDTHLSFLSELAQRLLAWSWQSFSAFLCFCLVYISSS